VRYVLCGPDQPPGGYDGYENCDLVDLFNKALTQVDETERAATYAEIAKVLNDEQPQLYLWSLSGVHVVNKRLQGVTVPAFERYAFEEVNTWSVTQ
jgi:ABC-type transport system substrate-binding protein